MDFNARVDINCERKDRLTEGWTENPMAISHLAKAGATKTQLKNMEGGVGGGGGG